MMFPTELRRRRKSKNKSYVERDVVLSENVYMMHPYSSCNQTKHLNPLWDIQNKYSYVRD